jgi:xanthine dehydrogenase molybdenum-binding subunit
LDLEPLPVVTDPLEALQPNAPQLHEGGNLLKHIKVRHGDVNRGFAEADVIVENEYRLPFIEHAFMEPESAVAAPLGDRITVWVGSQNPYLERSCVAAALGVSEERVEVIDMHAGGGFGGKDDQLVAIFVALLAQATGRPVRLFYDRRESIRGHSKRHAWIVRSKWGATKAGKLTAIEAEIYADTGAYAHGGELIASFVSILSSGPYEVPNAKVDTYVVYTNNLVGGAMRAWDNQVGAFVAESQMDELAAVLGMHPLKIRWLNALREGSRLICGGTVPKGVGVRATLEVAARLVGVELGEANP